MTFRRRTILLAAGAVAAAVLIASVVVYVVTRNELNSQLNASLREKLTPGGPQAVQVHSAKISQAVLHAERERLSRALARLGPLTPYEKVTTPVPAGGTTSRRTGTAAGRGGHAPPRLLLELRALRSELGAAGVGPDVASKFGPLGAGPVATQGFSASGSATAPPKGGKAQPGANIEDESITPGPLAGFGLLTDQALLGPNAAIFRSASHGSGSGPGKLATVVTIMLPASKLGGATGYAQLVQPDGRILRSDATGPELPVTPHTRAVAAGRASSFFSDATIAGTRVRMLTARAPVEDSVWQVALPLTDVHNALSRLALVLALVCVGALVLAAILGLLVSRAALVPVRRLTGAAERVTQTQDLAHRIEAPAADHQDELGRLAISFNTMLAALERSRLAQRQLVSDASHELRTPLTSIRANLDALAAGASLPPAERARVIAAARAQLHELTVLVGDLIDLSNTGLDAAEVEDVRLDLAVAGALSRARLHAPHARFVLHAEPCLVRAAPRRLDRAIANLLDNAAKWNPPSPPAAAAVDVSVRDGCLRVRDHGPGIPQQDLPHVFDRFYRAPAARALPGSGLGLAIVRQVAETHGGSVHACNAGEGGAVLTLDLPVLSMTAADDQAAGQPPPADRHVDATRDEPGEPLDDSLLPEGPVAAASALHQAPPLL